MNQSPAMSSGFLVGIFLIYGFVILLSLASFVFWIIEIVDVSRREFKDQNSKLLWLLVVVLGHGLGALVYYLAGRSQGWLPGETPLYSAVPPTGYSAPPPPGQWPPPGAAPPTSSSENRQE